MSQLRHKKSFEGFTLIELMVVVAIIGILAAIGIALYSQAQNRAKDANVRATVKSIQAAVEQKYLGLSSYHGITLSGDDFSAGQNPLDQTTVYQFTTNQAATQHGYCISGLLPSGVGGNCTAACANNATSFTSATNGTHFCATNMQ